MHEDRKTRDTLTVDDPHVQVEFLASKTGLKERFVKNELRYMKNLGLVESTESSPEGPYLLTAKGFNVVHERELKEDRQHHEQELNKQQTMTNQYLVLVTFALVITGGIQTIIEVYSVLGWGWKFILSIIVAISLLVIAAAGYISSRDI